MLKLMDMGEPTKIVGIEITQEKNSVKITQTKYFESILQQEGMEKANTIKMPLNLKLPI